MNAGNLKLFLTFAFLMAFIPNLLLSQSKGEKAAKSSDAKVQVCGISVALPDPASEFGQSMVMGRTAGVEIHLQFEDKNVAIVSVVDEGENTTKLQILADGKALENSKDLMHTGFMSHISPDKHRAVVPVMAKQVPAKGTKSLQVKGKIVILAGSEPKTEKVTFKLATDEKVNVGPIDAKISSVDVSNFDEKTTSVTIESSKSMETVESIKFLDQKGKELKSNSGGSSSFGFENQKTYSTTYHIVGEPKEITAEVSFFANTKLVEVPVDVVAELGLGK